MQCTDGLFKFFVYFFLTCQISFAQETSPQTFEAFVQSLDAPTPSQNLSVIASAALRKTEATVDLVITIQGRVHPSSHLYSVFPQGDFSPEPTKIVLNHPLFEVIKGPSESPTVPLYDSIFEQTLNVHRGDFWMQTTYRYPRKAEELRILNGYLLYQICDNSTCSLPKQALFSVDLSRLPQTLMESD